MRRIFSGSSKYAVLILIGIVILLVLLSTFVATITATHTPTATPIQSIGQVQRIQGAVQSGPESSLANVDSTRIMDNKDAVHVFNHGKANLDFHYGLMFTFYNDTIAGATTIGTEESSRQAVIKLSQGGLQGHNPPGSKTTVELPNGVNILILGTDYFITYDPIENEAWVYNFDGTLQYQLPSGGYQDLPSKLLLKIDNGQVTRLYQGPPFSMDDFDYLATKLDSPIKAVRAILGTIPSTGGETNTPTATQMPTFTRTLTPTLGTAIVGTTSTQPSVTPLTIIPTTQFPTPNMTQTIQAAFDDVNKQFKDSLRANIAYNIPRSMKLGQTIKIELLLKPSQYQFEQATQLVEQNNFLTLTAEAGVLATKVIEEGGLLTSTSEPGQPVGRQGEEHEVITSDVIITPLMKATLKSLKPGAFEIQELHDNAAQPISSIETTKWRWSVTAKEAGEQTLEIEISRLVKKDNNEYWPEVDAYSKVVTVQVTASQWLKSLDWKWILGILITALLIPLFFRWYDHRKKEIDKHKQPKPSKQKRRTK